MTQEDDKREVAAAAIAELPESGVVGLGSGSTARLFIERLADLVRGGRSYAGVPTSSASRALAASLGVPLLDDAGPWSIDVTVDGADEVSDALDLIKGGGAAHTREKIVNDASRRNVIVVDASKLSRRLGERRAVPVEVLAFGHAETMQRLAAHGQPQLRRDGGAPVVSDSGNLLVDVATGPIDDPAALARELAMIPGVVETGLFVGRADLVLVAQGGVVRRLTRT